MIPAELLQRIKEAEQQARACYTDVCHDIFAHPEPGLQEYYAADLLTRTLQSNGFTVTRPVAGVETAFTAEYGSGHPHIALLAEYDALPGYGPQNDQWGHACGHNWIAANTLGAALILKQLMDEGLISGTVCYVGCPAEETVGCKADLVKAGIFDDTDLAMQIHIMGGNGADLGYRALAMNSIEFTYHGVSSHAAGAPERGVNALDACYLTFNGINALRQHITSDARIHGIVCDGGLAPNVVPALTRSRFYIRAEKREYVDELEQKVLHCAEGACLMTGASYEWRYFENSFDNYEGIPFLSDVFEEALVNAGVTGIRKAPRPYSGSTDVGNVSRVCPTAYCELGAGNTDGTNVHEEAFLPYVDGVNASESLKQAVLAQAILAADFCSDPAKQEELYRLRDAIHARR